MPDTAFPSSSAVIELRVRNHPGTMSHITGLFARRGFNMEAILCVPEPDRLASRILLLAGDEPRLDQVEKQLARLHDVLEVRHRPDLGPALFASLGDALLAAGPSRPAEGGGADRGEGRV